MTAFSGPRSGGSRDEEIFRATSEPTVGCADGARKVTTLVVPIPEAEEAVGRWRERYDWSARVGVPPHITVLGPFLPPRRITDSVIERLTSICSDLPRVALKLEGPALLESTVCLTPNPREPFELMTRLLEHEWRGLDRGGSQDEKRLHHLTVARNPEEVRELSLELEASLPIEAQADELRLYEHTGRLGVNELCRFRFGG
jgi:2'-5' RNA ligase